MSDSEIKSKIHDIVRYFAYVLRYEDRLVPLFEESAPEHVELSPVRLSTEGRRLYGLKVLVDWRYAGQVIHYAAKELSEELQIVESHTSTTLDNKALIALIVSSTGETCVWSLLKKISRISGVNIVELAKLSDGSEVYVNQLFFPLKLFGRKLAVVPTAFITAYLKQKDTLELMEFGALLAGSLLKIMRLDRISLNTAGELLRTLGFADYVSIRSETSGVTVIDLRERNTDEKLCFFYSVIVSHLCEVEAKSVFREGTCSISARLRTT
ncbi:MAG: hypothetical protein N3E36_02425 [Sulfolobales archaeon]|nr:hypothetical protein [Sulfolobales archaeon]